MFRGALLLGVVVGLAACGSAPPATGRIPFQTTGGVDKPVPPPPVPPPPPVAVAAPSITVASLKGLEPKGVVAILGEPGLLRRDSPAEVWQYHGVNCVMDLFLYEDHGVRRVAHVQVRPLNNEGGRLDEATCLSHLARPLGVTHADDNRPPL